MKDSNKFYMPRTLLDVVPTLHVKEWGEFLRKPDALGLRARFQIYDSNPLLGRAEDVMDEEGYSLDVENQEETLGVACGLAGAGAGMLPISSSRLARRSRSNGL